MAKPKNHSVLGAVLLAIVLGSNGALAESSQKTLVQLIRELIGIDRDIAAGGSRSPDDPSICLISPRTEVNSEGEVSAVVPVPMPTLLTAGPLSEVRIYREGLAVWRKVASTTTAIEGPLYWPVEPVKPNERLTVWLRPRGASGGDFAKITLIGDSQASMNVNQRLLAEIGEDPRSWLKLLKDLGDNDFCQSEF